jgi:hypothetical protein
MIPLLCTRLSRRSSAGRGSVEQVGDLDDGLGAGLDVAHGGAGAAMPGLGHDQLEGGALLPERGGGRVPELVQVPSGLPVAEAGVVVEQDAGAVVAEAGPACIGTQVLGPGHPGRDGPALGEEQRAAGAPVDQAGQEAGGAGGPVHVLDRPALGADLGAVPLQVEHFDVQRQELCGAGGGSYTGRPVCG